MTQQNSPSPAGARGGILGALSGLGWPVFIIDEILEHAPKIANGIKEGAWGKVLLGLLIILGALLVSPFLWAFVVPAWLANTKLGLDLMASLKVGVASELVWMIILGGWIHKKLRRDPWDRALDRAQIILAKTPNIAYTDLCAQVNTALNKDERALPFADDAASVVMWETLGGKPHRPWWRRFRIRISWPFHQNDGGRDQELECFKAPPSATNQFSTPRPRNYGGLRDPMRQERR